MVCRSHGGIDDDDGCGGWLLKETSKFGSMIKRGCVIFDCPRQITARPSPPIARKGMGFFFDLKFFKNFPKNSNL